MKSLLQTMRMSLTNLLPAFFFIGLFIWPGFIAHAGLVPCGGSSVEIGPQEIEAHECTFADLITLAKNITNYIIYAAAPLAAIMFTYAGILYLTAAGDTGKINKAHGIFWTVFVGFVIVLSAWLIVKVVSVIVTPDFRATT